MVVQRRWTLCDNCETGVANPFAEAELTPSGVFSPFLLSYIFATTETFFGVDFFTELLCVLLLRDDI
jgi:hypothetical protein